MSVAFLIIGAGIVGFVLHWTMDQRGIEKDTLGLLSSSLVDPEKD